jgi:hypothetical protein
MWSKVGVALALMKNPLTAINIPPPYFNTGGVYTNCRRWIRTAHSAAVEAHIQRQFPSRYTTTATKNEKREGGEKENVEDGI